MNDAARTEESLPPAQTAAEQVAGPPARRRRRRVPRWLVGLLCLGLGYGVAQIVPIVVRPPLVVGQDAITNARSAAARVSLEDAGGQTLVIRPATGDGDVLLIFYPGGLVRPQAYEWLGRALAERGVMTVIPEFAGDLAVTGINRADPLIEAYAQGRPVVLGGHSLGGAMACDYASRNTGKLAGLLLEGAYPADNITVTRLPTLVLSAENDGLATPAKVDAGMPRLDPGAKLIRIPGSVHAFFGRYGPQSGDGIPTVDRAVAESAILMAITGWLPSVR